LCFLFCCTQFNAIYIPTLSDKIVRCQTRCCLKNIHNIACILDMTSCIAIVTSCYIEFCLCTAPPLVLITLLLGSLNSAINPWIYIFFHGYYAICCQSSADSSSSQRDYHRSQSTTTSHALIQLSLLGRRSRDLAVCADGSHCPPTTPVMTSHVTQYPTDV